MPDTFNFGVEPITCHAWNHDRSRMYFVILKWDKGLEHVIGSSKSTKSCEPYSLNTEIDKKR